MSKAEQVAKEITYNSWALYTQRDWEQREIEHQAELRILRDKNEKLRRALRTAQERFTNPQYGCVWKDAAEDIEGVLKEKP